MDITKYEREWFRQSKVDLHQRGQSMEITRNNYVGRCCVISTQRREIGNKHGQDSSSQNLLHSWPTLENSRRSLLRYFGGYKEGVNIYPFLAILLYEDRVYYIVRDHIIPNKCCSRCDVGVFQTRYLSEDLLVMHGIVL